LILSASSATGIRDGFFFKAGKVRPEYAR